MLISRLRRTLPATSRHARSSGWRAKKLWVGGSAILAACLLLYAAIFLLPRHLVAGSSLTRYQLLTARNDLRSTLLTALAGLTLFSGAAVGWAQLRLGRAQLSSQLEGARKQNELILEGQLTERLTRAVELLANGTLTARVGALYALERIALDSSKDCMPVLEILSTYLREWCPWPTPQAAADSSVPYARPNHQILAIRSPDAQAIVSAFCRRRQEHEEEGFLLRLSGIDLSGANLRNGKFQTCDLSDTCFHHANLVGTHLEFADLSRTILEGADLSGAFLQFANLRGADVHGASLAGAFLQGADLSEVIGLTEVQIKSALIDEATTLPWDAHRSDKGARRTLNSPGERFYKILSRSSGKALDVTAASHLNGALVQQFVSWNDSLTMAFAQHWRLLRATDSRPVTPEDTSKRIKIKITSRLNGKVIEPCRHGQDDGVGIQVWTDHGDAIQYWYMVPAPSGAPHAFCFLSAASGKYLDVRFYSKADGPVIQQWSSNGSRAQEWCLSPVVG